MKLLNEQHEQNELTTNEIEVNSSLFKKIYKFTEFHYGDISKPFIYITIEIEFYENKNENKNDDNDNYSDNDDERFADTNDYYTMMWNIEDYNDSDIVQIISNGIMLYDRTPTGAINLIKRKYRARNFRQRARSGFVKNKALGQILLAPE